MPIIVNPEKVQQEIKRLSNVLPKALQEAITEIDKEIEMYDSEIKRIEKELKDED